MRSGGRFRWSLCKICRGHSSVHDDQLSAPYCSHYTQGLHTATITALISYTQLSNGEGGHYTGSCTAIAVDEEVRPTAQSDGVLWCVSDDHATTICPYGASLVPRPSSTLTFGGPGMPNQMFEWVEPRQRFCTHCHYDNFLGTPTATYSLLEKSGAAAIIGELLPGSGSC